MSLIMAEVVGRAGATVRVPADDTSQDLFTDGGMDLVNASGKSITSALITIEENGVRFAFETAAVQTLGSEVGHKLDIGMSFVVVGYSNLVGLRFINAENGADGVLMVTPRYGY